MKSLCKTRFHLEILVRKKTKLWNSCYIVVSRSDYPSIKCIMYPITFSEKSLKRLKIFPFLPNWLLWIVNLFLPFMSSFIAGSPLTINEPIDSWKDFVLLICWPLRHFLIEGNDESKLQNKTHPVARSFLWSCTVRS